MNILALKLILAPLIIGSASLAGRRWGPAVSGWIVGMPLTSGPVVFFVALSHGVAFAENSALGVLNGGISLVLYTLSYAWLATRFKWTLSIVGSLSVFLVSTFILQTAVIPLHIIVPLVLSGILLTLFLLPKGAPETGESNLSRWDIPARILIGTSVILLLTGIAPFIGPRLTGLLTTIPLYVSILTVYAHRDHGPAAGTHVLRGLLYGMFAFTGFFFVLSLSIEHLSLGLSFGFAALTALTTQGLSLLILKKFQA